MGTTPEHDPRESLMSVGAYSQSPYDSWRLHPGRDEYPLLSPKDRAISGTYAVEPDTSTGRVTAADLRARLGEASFLRR